MKNHEPQSIKRIAPLVRAFIYFTVAACAQQPQQQPHVVLNEILFQPDSSSTDPIRTHDWVELYNGSGADVSLAGWSITARNGRNGASARPLPAVTFPAGAYLVVQFATGASNLDFSSGSATFYTGDDPSTPYWNPVQDEAALYSPQTIVDFLSWTQTGNAYQPGKAYNDALSAGIWFQGGVLLWDNIQNSNTDRRHFAQPGVSIGRDANSTDTHAPEDFCTHGGANAADISPGRQNLDYADWVAASELPLPAQIGHVRFNPNPVLNGLTGEPGKPALSFGSSQAEWTILLYASANNSLEQEIYGNLKQIEQAIRANNNTSINFVVEYAGKLVSRHVVLDSSGQVTSVTGANGNAFRGRLTEIPVNPTAPAGRNILPYIAVESPAGQSPDLGKIDMGDPQTLKNFIAWGKANYPAQRYALIISSHGDGWKYIGPDENSPGTREPFDALYLGELTTALSGQQFDMIILDACMMGMAEVAWQLQPFANWLVASEDLVPGDGMAYPVWTADLLNNTSWDGQTLGRDMVKAYRAYYQSQDPDWGTISLTNESLMPGLIAAIDTFAKSMRTGAGLFKTKDQRADNVQLLMAGDANNSPRFADRNFIDLYHFALLVQADAGIPDCAKTGVSTILTLLDSASPDGSRVVDSEDSSYGGAVPNPNHVAIGGLTIHMPHYRTLSINLTRNRLNAAGIPVSVPVMQFWFDAAGTLQQSPVVLEQPYDMPDSRVADGSSIIAIYNSNNDQLPLLAKDPETGSLTKPLCNPPSYGCDGTPFNPRTEWPSVPTPSFRFVQNTAWSLFLERFYHPVADNTIVNGIAPNGNIIDPVTTTGGACMNSSDSIAVPVGSTVYFTAFGSSDIDDSPAGSVINAVNYAPLHFFWDPNAAVINCNPCTFPYGVPPGSDPSLATDNIDADFDFVNTLFDENVADSVNFSIVCPAPGTFVVTLTVWDDNYTFINHNTLPTAEYVHPQSSSNPATVACVGTPAGPPPTLNGVAPGILTPPGSAILVPGSTPQTITIEGENFKPGLIVTLTPPESRAMQFSGSQILNFTPTGFHISVTLSVSGIYTVVVTNPDGGVSSPLSFMVTAPTPMVTGITPNLQPSSSNQTITINGGNFQSGLTVLLNGPGVSQMLDASAISNFTASSFGLTLSLPVTGNYSLLVANPGGTQSNVFNFAVGSSAPVLTAISPATLLASSIPQTLSVSASGLQGGLTVQIASPGGAVAATASAITATGFQIAAILSSAGGYSIQVTNPGGQKSNALTFTVSAPTAPPPVISGISPANLQASPNQQSFTVIGSGFQNALTVQLSGPGGMIPATAANEAGVGFPTAAVLPSAGTYTLQVINPDGQKSNTLTFTVSAATAPPPAISGINPANPQVSSNQQSFSVSGSGFQSGLMVQLSGLGSTIPATAANVTATGFQFAAALSSVGTYTLQATNSGGQKSNLFTFTVSAPITTGAQPVETIEKKAH